MAKEDIVNAYLEEFMDGRSPEYREKFLAKSIDNQYASIAGWRRRNKKSSEKGAAPLPKSNLLATLRKARVMLENTENITEKETDRLRAEVDLFLQTLANHAEIRRKKEIELLEAEREIIDRKIEKLRSNNEV